MKARLISDPEPHSGGFHMTADDFLADSAADSDYQAVLRFFLWQPPAVSIGYHQRLETINLDACRKRGWEVVRRPTGGRALLHLEDVSYSLILTSAEDVTPQLKRIYTGIAEAFREVLLLQFNVLCDPVDCSASLSNRPGDRLCLSTRTRGELTVGGKKIAAAAQRIYRRSVLQHGSLPLRGDVGAIAEVLDLEPERRKPISEQLRRQALTLEQAAGRFIPPEEFVSAAVPIIARRFNLDLEMSEWTRVEIAQINRNRSRLEVLSL